MRALLVDDEPIARRVLREELEAFPNVSVVAEADTGLSALEAIERHHPEVVFLDLQMPIMNGFETIAQLQGPSPPAIVILTAYDEFAIQAFEAGAIDYLLKPVGQARLQQTIDRIARLLLEPKQVAEKLARLRELQPVQDSDKLQKIVGKYREEYFLLNVPDVFALQAEGELTWIWTAAGRYLATQNLKALEAKLKGTPFRRIHRNALINVNQVQKMSMITSQRWMVTMTNGQHFTVSKRMARNVRDVLHW